MFLLRYIHNQRHKMSCGAVAFINCLKFFGGWNATNKTILELRNAGFWDKDYGMDIQVLELLLLEHGFKINKLENEQSIKSKDAFYILFEQFHNEELHVSSRVYRNSEFLIINSTLTLENKCDIVDIWEVSVENKT